jgi:hypothetical protein
MLAMLLQENQMSPDQAMKLMMAIIPLFGLFMLIGIAIVMIPCWFILKKAGFSPWLSLLCLIPSLGTLVLLYILAFADWKVIPAPQAAYPPPYPPPPYPPTPQPPAQS